MQRHRPIVMATNGLVSSGHPLASQTGVRVMQEGGNAFDAAVAAAAVLAVCKPSMTGMGGDNMSLLWHAKSQELLALNSNGFAPKAATVEAYREGIPERGPRAVSVPGTVGGWEAILSRFGTKRLEELLQPAIGYAERGFAVNHQLRSEIVEEEAVLRQWPASAAIFLPGGRVPEPTELLVQPDLAKTLGIVARQGARAFYEGEIAQRIGEFMAKGGGLIAAGDLAAFQPQWKTPIRTSYRGVEFFGQPAPSQGFIIGQELNVLEGFDVRSLTTAELVHLMVEAKKLAFADRDRHLADPDFHAVPVDLLLSKEHAERQRKRIGERAAERVQAPDPAQAGGETTYLCAVDGQGNAVSFIQSVFHGFGAGVVAGDTGIVLNNRMLGFNVLPGHPNCVGPRRRPVITLNACMLFKDSRPWIVYGTPGADAQVQTNFQHAVDWVDFGMDVQAAIEWPRWRHLPDNSVLLEERFPSEVADGLRARGHQVQLGEAWESQTGGAEAIMIDWQTGLLQGGADPRREGYAVGY